MIASTLPSPTAVASVLVLAALAAGLRIGVLAHRGQLPGVQAMLILGLQTTTLALLYLLLFPPTLGRESGTLTVLTAEADIERLRGPVVALPEAGGHRGAEPWPDLASALRAHPGARRLDVRGRGLELRDRDAARDLAVHFSAPDLPHGMVALDAPARTVVGSPGRLRGEVAGIPGGSIELRGPGGSLQARSPTDAAGLFELPLATRAAGRLLFELRVLDDEGQVIERVEVPVVAVAPAALEVLVLAGAPGQELKFLRRWAVDAGLVLHTRIQLGREAALDTGIDVDATSLAASDLVVLDTRSWTRLGAPQRDALHEAILDGLGVLLRLDALPEETLAADLASMGFVLDEDPDASLELHLSGSRAAPDTGSGPALTRRPFELHAEDAAVLAASDAGEALGRWRQHGRGRIGVLWLDDSHRLALGAGAAAHGALWSRLVGTLARASGGAGIATGVDAGVDRRRTLCGLSAESWAHAPSGTRTPLVPQTGGCTGYWPAEPGWHRIEAGGESHWLHVRQGRRGAGLEAAELRDATLALAARPAGLPAASGVREPASRWPFFLVWLLACTALWWLERRGRHIAPRA